MQNGRHDAATSRMLFGGVAQFESTNKQGASSGGA